MLVGDRFEKDGKLFECTSVSDLGIGYRRVKEEVFEATPEVTFEETVPEPVEEPVKRTRRRVKK
jgi:hypothetical protein